ncbi:MAG: Gfo/Idh/MocA family oxidoreductase [Candidatus Omnitrophica bacterium]|nr:Gfo/Idh/MocA family oxidoreductase [Candidatus Omnitrophota bacterium]
MEGSRWTRRGFLKTSIAAAGAAPYVIPSGALGNDTIPPPSERITLGHIGVGGRGTALQKEFQDLAEAQSVAVCDPFKDRREERAAAIDSAYAEDRSRGSYKGCAIYNDFRELLARDDIDAVVVATPDHWHVPIALEAARAGKDMYVEKPLGVSLAQDFALRRAIHRYSRVFQYGTQQRSSKYFHMACELVRNHRVGELKSIDVWCAAGGCGGSVDPIEVPEGFDYNLWLGPAPESPYTSDRCLARGGYWISDYSLGFIAGWGVHPLDIAQWGMDADGTGPIRVETVGIIPSDGLYDTISTWDARCWYRNGVEIHFMSEDLARPIVEKYRVHHDHGTTFFGTEGWISVDRGGIHAGPPALLEAEVGPEGVHLTKSKNHRKNFLEAVRSRGETISPIESAVRVDTLSHLCNMSARLGRPIRWDPDREAPIGDSDAERMMARPMRSPWTV